jgi:hypothetical protein
MAIQSQPSRISEPFAGSGTKNTIPATNATPSASQAASWASGFPPECSQPISAGGCPVPRNDMNGVLNQLSQDFAFRQDGGMWAWSASADYDTQRMVRGSDGLLYWSVAQSGPNVGGAQDPTTDNGTYWQAMPMDDANVVHKAGGETITGKKTFQNSSGTPVEFSSPDFDKDSASISSPITNVDIKFNDKQGYTLGNLFFQYPDANVYSGEARIQLGIGYGTWCGHSYSDAYLWLRSLPDGPAFVDTRPMSIHGASLPFLCLCNQSITKGTYPSSEYSSAILFSDKNMENIYSNANRDKSLLGGLYCTPNPQAYNRVSIVTCKNLANSGVSTSVVLQYSDNDAQVFFPNNNGVVDLGAGGRKWAQIYSTSATINTSDARLKTEPETVPDDVLDAWGDVNFVQFQMLDAVDKKGADKARLHNGLIAQRIDEAFKARGLDASRYGLFCFDKWEAEPEQKDEDGNILHEGSPAGDCYALRYEEALCMEAAYQRRRADRAEARLAALEERLAAIEAKLG